MRIRDLLAAESIELNGSATDKKDVLNKMVDLMAKSGKINNIETYRAGVFAREEEGTTGIGPETDSHNRTVQIPVSLVR